MKWELAPPTLNMWTNWYIGQWDTYIQFNEAARNNELVKSLQDPIVVFKLPNDKSYARYRELCQLVDLASLDIATLQYSPRALIASGMYVLLAFHFGQATKEDIIERFTKSSSFVTAQCPFNDLFSHYLHTSFGYELPELLPTIQFMSPFMGLPFSYVTPSIRRQPDDPEVCIYRITEINSQISRNSYPIKCIIHNSWNSSATGHAELSIFSSRVSSASYLTASRY